MRPTSAVDDPVVMAPTSWLADVSGRHGMIAPSEGLVTWVTLNYRSMFEVPDSTDALVLASSHFRSWLQSKRDDPRSSISTCDWDGPGVYDVGDGACVVEAARDEQDGSRLLRLTLEETTDIGRWITDLTAAERPGRGSWSRFIWVETSNVSDSNGNVPARDPMPPRLVRNLLGEVSGFNGAARLTARPNVVRGDDEDAVDELLAALRDGDRAVPIVVGAGFDEVSLESWTRAIAQLTRHGVGILAPVVLDPSAAESLNRWLGRAHAVPIGGVRTFHPAVRPGDDADAHRHRYITTSTMTDIVGRDASGRITVRPALAHAVAWNARRAVLDAGIPSRVRRVDELLRREHARLTVEPSTGPSLIERITVDSPSPVDGMPAQVAAVVDLVQVGAGDMPVLDEPLVASLLRLRESVGSIFETDDVTDDHVVKFSQLVSALAHDVPVLEAEITTYEQLLVAAGAESDDLRSRLNDAELAAAIAEADRRVIERQALWFQRQLKDAQRYDALVVPGEPAAPEDVADLMDRLSDRSHDGRPTLLDHVIFTGDREACEELLRYDTLGRIAGVCWDVLLTLGDYADAKCTEDEPPRNLYDYLQSTPAGRHAVSGQKYAASESKSVSQNPEWRAERTFPVPRDIDPTESVFMGAHFKLGGGDTVSSRLYLHDAVDVDGNVYVGYIGPHPTNTLT